MVTSLFVALTNRGALSIPDASFTFARASYLVSGEPCSTVRREQKAFEGFHVSSAVIGVVGGLTSATVRMHRKRGLRSRFVKDVASWPRRLVESQNGQGSREAPGPFVPGRVRFAPSLRMLFFEDVQVRMRVRYRLIEGRVARTSQRSRCNFWTPRNGSWWRTVVSSERQTSQFSKHVPSCMLFVVQKVVIRRDAS